MLEGLVMFGGVTLIAIGIATVFFWEPRGLSTGPPTGDTSGGHHAQRIGSQYGVSRDRRPGQTAQFLDAVCGMIECSENNEASSNPNRNGVPI
jgi:hypothetical protein